MENPITEIRRMLDESSQIEVAKELGVSPQYLSDVVNDRRKPGKKILKPLGLERVTTYRRTKKQAADSAAKPAAAPKSGLRSTGSRA